MPEASKGSLSVPQDLGFRQVSGSGHEECTLTPAGSRPPSGRGVSVKTAERGVPFQVQAALARGWSEQRLHTGRKARKERPWLVYLGREVLAPRAEVSHT